jgi:hypothetical protein
MDTDKLFKAIQILVKEEVKKQLPKLIKEEIDRRLISENKKQPKKSVAPKQTYSKNSMINDILNETRYSNSMMSDDTEFRTLNFDSSNINDVAFKTSMAAKMGYGDFAPPTTTLSNGMQADASNPAVKNVMDAMTRNYSELVKRF